MTNIFIIGMGLIGGSLSLALKNDSTFHRLGYDISEDETNMAHQLGVIDERVTRLQDGAERADVIIIATPVGVTIKIMEQLSTMALKKRRHLNRCRLDETNNRRASRATVTICVLYWWTSDGWLA